MTRHRCHHRCWAALVAGRLLAGLLLFSGVASAERIKDLATVYGVRPNQLAGYGLIIGLPGTGDQTSQTPFTVQSIRNMLLEYGVVLPPEASPQLKNVAAVMVHAELPAFVRPGQAIDVTVSSIGNAMSLRGGTLLMAPLKGADGQVYAMAQGNVVVGGFGAAGSDGSKVMVNVPSSGRIPGGATVERSVPNAFAQSDAIVLTINTPDFTTASRMVAAINHKMGDDSARAIDGASVRVPAPTDTAARVAFVSELENLVLEPGAAPARVVVNSRTGTVVIGSNVRISPAAVTHGSLTVTVTEKPVISQPNALSQGQTVVAPQTSVEVAQEGRRMFLLDAGVSLGDLVRAVNQVGVAPGDLVAILEALRQAGALRAELVVI